MHELAVDRDRFLFLVCAIAAQSCGKSPTDASVAAPVVVASVEPVAADASVETRAVVEAPIAVEDAGPSACEAENDVGEVDCAKIKARRLGGPSCEGVAGTCDLLARGYAYRPRAAQAIAACFDRLGARVCDIRARTKCFEEGVKASCAEPAFEEACDEQMAACRTAGVRIDYTREDCMKALSSLKGGDRDWARTAMGPSSEGKCRLMFTVF